MNSLFENASPAKQYRFSIDQCAELEVTGLDLLSGNVFGTGFFIYDHIPDMERLLRSIQQALHLYPTFSGNLIERDGRRLIAIGNSELVLDLIETRRSLLAELPLTNDGLKNVVDIIGGNSPENVGSSTFKFTLVINPEENSSILLWNSQHDHADGISIFMFLKKISDLYNGVESSSREDTDRVPYIKPLISGTNPSGARYLGQLGKNLEEDPYEFLDNEQNSHLIRTDQALFDLLKRSPLSRRKALVALMIKLHAQCVDIESFTLFKVLDIRNKELLPVDYCGNGLLFDSLIIETAGTRDQSLEEIHDKVTRSFGWDAEAARAAVAWLESKKGGELLRLRAEGKTGLLDGIFSGQGLVVDDLTYFPVGVMKLDRNPVWYDSPIPEPAHVISILPVSLDEQPYIRVNGPKDYVDRFVRLYHQHIHAEQ